MESKRRTGWGEGEEGDEEDRDEEEAAGPRGRARACGASWASASRCCAASPCGA